MDSLFTMTLNMSLTGTFVIFAVCLARLALKKVPKIISYCLWAVVGFRLVFPFSIESAFSLIPFNAELIPPDITMQPMAYVDSISLAGGNPLQLWLTVGLFVWLTGVAVMFSYGMASYVVLKRKLRHATHIEANIYETQMIKTPFVFGVLYPRIYLPTYLKTQERRYIILHEQAHIKRCDNIVKLAACLILCIHWFNPFVWIAFGLMSMDMEMSCDERVLKDMGGRARKDYSLALLSLATEHHTAEECLIAFGGGDINMRIRNILNPKKQSFLTCSVLVTLTAVLSVGLAVNSAAPKENGSHQFYVAINEDQFADTVNGVFENFNSYMGKTVRVEGVFEYFGEETVYRAVLSRFGICCDPEGNLSLLVEWQDDNEYAEFGDRVEIAGTFDFIEKNGTLLKGIHLSSMRVLETSSN